MTIFYKRIMSCTESSSDRVALIQFVRSSGIPLFQRIFVASSFKFSYFVLTKSLNMICCR